MSTWNDDLDRTWTINLTLGLADRILERTQIDLLPDDNEYKDLMSLTFDRRKAAAVLWELSRKQAKEQGIEREPPKQDEDEDEEPIPDTSFNGALSPAAMMAGVEAIRTAIINFSMGQPALAKMIQETFDAHDRVLEAGVQMMIQTAKSGAMGDAIKEAVAEIAAELRKNLKAVAKTASRKALDNSATN